MATLESVLDAEELRENNKAANSAGFGFTSIPFIKVLYGASNEVSDGKGTPSHFYIKDKSVASLTVQVVDYRMKLIAFTKKGSEMEEVQDTLIVSRKTPRRIAAALQSERYENFKGKAEEEGWKLRADRTLLLWVEDIQDFACMDFKEGAQQYSDALISASIDGLVTVKNELDASLKKKKGWTVYRTKATATGKKASFDTESESFNEILKAFRSRDNLDEATEKTSEE